MPGLVLALEDDLLFVPRIEAGLRANGFRVRFVTGLPELGEALKAAPVLILVNIGSPGLPWSRLVALTKERRLAPHPVIVGYGPHVDLDLRQRALDAGCDAVVGRSAVVNSMDSLLARYAWKPDSSGCEGSPPPGVLQGIEQFNHRAFYCCHDSIEAAWVDEPRDVRLMYQGLLQIAVAFYQVQKGNWRGMVKMMARGKGKLLPFLPNCSGIDIEGFLARVEQSERTLQELGPTGLAQFDQFPTIAVDG